MASGISSWLKQNGVIILVLVLGVLASLVLVWWRLGFSLEIFQPFAAPVCERASDCDDGDPCTIDRCRTATGSPTCTHDPDPDPACGDTIDRGQQRPGERCNDDGDCWDPPGCDVQFCTGSPKTCKRTSEQCPAPGAPAPAPGEPADPGKCGSNCGTGVNQIDIQARRVDSVNGNQVTLKVGAKTGLPGNLYARIWLNERGNTKLGDFDLNKNGTVRDIVVNVPGPGTWTIVIDVEIQPGACINQCDGSVSATVTVQTPTTHSVCQNNACVSVAGAGTNECSTNADCTGVPQLACTPSTQGVLAGGTASFNATGGNGTYAWTAPSGSPAAGQGGTFGTSYTDDGVYTVTVTSGTESANCEVTVSSDPESLACSPSTQVVDIGEVANLSASGGSGTYDWDAPSGNPSSGAGGTFGVLYDDAGTYDVTVSDPESEEIEVCEVVVRQEEMPPEEEPELDLDKYVLTRGGSEVNTRTADPNETVEFIYYVQSNGTETLLDVRARDAVPAGLTYVSGTARLNGSTNISDGDFLNEISLGDMNPGEEHSISFDARVSNESFFDFGSTTLVNRAFAEADNAPEVSDTAFVVIEREPENPTLSIRKLGRNVSRNQVGEHTSVTSSPNEVIEFTIRVRNTSDAVAENVHVQDVVPQGVTYQAGTATLNGQPTSDNLVSGGINIGDLDPSEEAIVRFLGRVAPANQLPEGTTTLINIARTWADDIPTLQAQLPIVITNRPIDIPPVSTGPGETTVLALIISAIMTLMYIGYTSTSTFRRREALDISRDSGSGDFSGKK